MPDAISETGSEGIRAPAADPGQGTNDRRRTCHKDTRRTHAVCPPVSARGALQFQSHQSRPRHPRGLDWLDTPMSPCGFWRHGWGEPSLMPSSCQQGLERSIADSERHRLGRGSFRIALNRLRYCFADTRNGGYSSFSGPVKKSNRDWTVVDSPGNYWKRQRGTPGLSPAIPIPCNWVENRDNDQNNRKMSVRDLDGRMVSVPGPRVLCSDNIAGRSRVWSKNNTRNLDGPPGFSGSLPGVVVMLPGNAAELRGRLRVTRVKLDGKFVDGVQSSASYVSVWM